MLSVIVVATLSLALWQWNRARVRDERIVAVTREKTELRCALDVLLVLLKLLVPFADPTSSTIVRRDTPRCHSKGGHIIQGIPADVEALLTGSDAATVVNLAEQATTALASAEHFEWRYACAPEYVPQNANPTQGTLHHVFGIVLDTLIDSLPRTSKDTWRLRRQAKWGGESKKAPDFALVPSFIAALLFATWTGLCIEVKGNIPQPESADAAVSAARIRQATVHAELKLDLSRKGAQRAAAIDQTVAYLAHGAKSLHVAGLVLPFYRAFGLAVCGTDVCLVVLTVEGDDAVLEATGRKRTGGKSDTLGSRVVICIGRWLPYLPSGPSAPAPDGLQLLVRILLSPPASLCCINSLTYHAARFLPPTATLTPAPVTVLGTGGYGIILGASVQFAPTSPSWSLGRRGVTSTVAIKVPIASLAMAAAAGGATASEVAAAHGRSADAASTMKTVAAEAANMRRLTGDALEFGPELSFLASSMLRTLVPDEHATRTSWPDSVAQLLFESPTALVIAPVGTSLRDELMQPEFSTPAARVSFLRQLLPDMLRALIHCHARGIKHGDVRLQNFVLVPDDPTPPSSAVAVGTGGSSALGVEQVEAAMRAHKRVVLIDFGLSTVSSSEQLARQSVAKRRAFGSEDVAQLIGLFRCAAADDWVHHAVPPDELPEVQDASQALQLIAAACESTGAAAGAAAGAGASASATRGAASGMGVGAGSSTGAAIRSGARASTRGSAYRFATARAVASAAAAVGEVCDAVTVTDGMRARRAARSTA